MVVELLETTKRDRVPSTSLRMDKFWIGLKGVGLKERLPCEFFLIRYVPDVVKGEFTNIGVLLREAGRDDSAVVRFTRDWSRVRCMDADADIGLLEGLEGEIAQRLRMGAADTKPVMQVLEDTLSNSLQITQAQGLPGGECTDGDGAVDADVCRAAEGEGGAEEERARGDCGGDADGV